MSLEGHWCGPESCPECGETHGCICGNCDWTEDEIRQYNEWMNERQEAGFWDD